MLKGMHLAHKAVCDMNIKPTVYLCCEVLHTDSPLFKEPCQYFHTPSYSTTMKLCRFCTEAAVISTLFSLALASPITSSLHTPGVVRAILSKRRDPDTAGNLVEPEVSVVEQGFKDVIQLASYVVVTSDQTVNPIFEKYFDGNDQQTVIKVFNQIMGNPEDPRQPDPTRNDLLGDIFVQKQDGDSKCDGRTLAYMDDFETDKPTITVCNILFEHKGIFDTTCEELGDHVSYKMLTTGGTLLHEYT
jgi:hypothetical protein